MPKLSIHALLNVFFPLAIKALQVSPQNNCPCCFSAASLNGETDPCTCATNIHSRHGNIFCMQLAAEGPGPLQICADEEMYVT